LYLIASVVVLYLIASVVVLYLIASVVVLYLIASVVVLHIFFVICQMLCVISDQQLASNHWQCVAVCCSVLQCVAVCCSVISDQQLASNHWSPSKNTNSKVNNTECLLIQLHTNLRNKTHSSCGKRLIIRGGFAESDF